jgi:hypothetical protein
VYGNLVPAGQLVAPDSLPVQVHAGAASAQTYRYLLNHPPAELLLLLLLSLLCRLAKDPSRWGVVEGGNSVSLFYVLHAPWCKGRREVPEELRGHIPPYDRPPHVSSAADCSLLQPAATAGLPACSTGWQPAVASCSLVLLRKLWLQKLALWRLVLVKAGCTACKWTGDAASVLHM